jgi:hypothetical protein
MQNKLETVRKALDKRRSLLIAMGVCMGCGKFLPDETAPRRLCEICLCDRRRRQYKRFTGRESTERIIRAAHQQPRTKLGQIAFFVNAGICLDCRVEKKPENDTICSQCREVRFTAAETDYNLRTQQEILTTQ